MAEPLLGDIRIMRFDFPLQGKGLCDRQLLPINHALFSPLGTTFALPNNLQGSAPAHPGQGPGLSLMSEAFSRLYVARAAREPPLLPHSRVEGVSQPVAEQGEADHDHAQDRGREPQEVGMKLHHFGPLVDQGPERGTGYLDAEPDEA